MTRIIKPSEGDFFVQTEMKPFEHLTCVGLEDLPQPRGSLAPVYEPAALKGTFSIAGFIRGEAEAGSTRLSRPLEAVENWLLEQTCEFQGLVTWNCRGSRGDPNNFDVATVLIGCYVSSSSITGMPVAQTPGERDRVSTQAEISYQARELIYQLTMASGSLSATVAANAIAFLPSSCGGDCGQARQACRTGYIGMDGQMYNALLLKTTDGTTWTEVATDPFVESGGDISSVVVLEYGDDHRVAVARGSPIEYYPAEVAYSDDGGETWTNVFVGNVNGQVVNRLYLDQATIWSCAGGGYIYRSLDLGTSWETVCSGLTTNDLRDVCVHKAQVYAVGDNNTFLYSKDGQTWISRTGPAPAADLLSVAVNRWGYVLVGAADGTIYTSTDQGRNWQEVISLGAGTIPRIVFDADHRYFGYLIHNTAAGAGRVYRSIDGGASWQGLAGQSGTWNSGLNDVTMCGINQVLAVGEVYDGNAVIARSARRG